MSISTLTATYAWRSCAWLFEFQAREIVAGDAICVGRLSPINRQQPLPTLRSWITSRFQLLEIARPNFCDETTNHRTCFSVLSTETVRPRLRFQLTTPDKSRFELLSECLSLLTLRLRGECRRLQTHTNTHRRRQRNFLQVNTF